MADGMTETPQQRARQERLRRAAEIIKRLPAGPCEAVEVGVEIGALSVAILAGHPDVYLNMVDNWLPTEQQPPEYVRTRDPSALRTGDEQLRRIGEAMAIVGAFLGRSTCINRGSIAAAGIFPAARLDLVYIDADHSYPAVLADIDAWWPKVRPGGWIGGHDYGNPSTEYDFSGVKRAVDLRFPDAEIAPDYQWFKQKAW